MKMWQSIQSFCQNKSIYLIRDVILIHLTGCRWAPNRQLSNSTKNGSGYQASMPTSPYLFHIEDDNEFQGCNGREKGWEKGSDPANGLPINDPQHIVRNGKFLLSPTLHQLPRGTVGHQEPGNKWDQFSLGHKASATATEPCLRNQGCFHTDPSWTLVRHKSRRFRAEWILESWRPRSESQIDNLRAK